MRKSGRSPGAGAPERFLPWGVWPDYAHAGHDHGREHAAPAKTHSGILSVKYKPTTRREYTVQASFSDADHAQGLSDANPLVDGAQPASFRVR
jgi:hypothetical protein